MRAEERVKRAAELAAKTYLEDVSMRVERVGLKKKKFNAEVMQDAHK